MRDPVTQKEYAMKVHFETGTVKSGSIEEKKRAITVNDAKTIPKIQGHPNIIELKEVF